MLQAHSFLWHYLWVAPNVFLLALAFLACKRKLHKQFPVFVTFAAVGALEQLAVYAADVIPSVSAESFLRGFLAGVLVLDLIQFALIRGIFFPLFWEDTSVGQRWQALIRA